MFDLFKDRIYNVSGDNTISLEAFINDTIQEFETSTERRLMSVGQNYYENRNDINSRTIKTYDKNGNEIIDETKPNNKIPHAFMKLSVDEKVAYFLGQPISFTSDNKKLLSFVQDILNDDFSDVLNDVGVEASNKGIAWLHIYIDSDGEFKYMLVPSEQVIPLWADMGHTKLDALIRYYYVEVYDGPNLIKERKVEYWENDGVTYYKDVDGILVYDIEANEQGQKVGHFTLNDEERGWGLIPFIPFKNNSKELPDVYFVKDIIDQYDKITSDNSNEIEEVQDMIFVLKNYGGTNLAEFMRDLKYYKAVKVDGDGGVETIHADINTTASESTLNRLKKDFYQFSQSVDLDTEKFGNSPSGVAIEFIYSKLKLKVDNMERKFKKSFRELFYFLCEYAKAVNEGVFNYKDIKVTFTRSIIANMNETINTVNSSTALISKKTALAHHPWIDDVEEELHNIEAEKETINFDKFSYEDEVFNDEETEEGDGEGADE